MKTAVLVIALIVLAPVPSYAAEAAKPSANEVQIKKQIEEIKAAKQRELMRYQRAQYLIDLEKAKDDAVLNIRALEEKEQELTQRLNHTAQPKEGSNEGTKSGDAP